MSDRVIPPQLTFEVRPTYPAAAMRARVEGTVVLACVVTADGSVGPVRVTRSLDAERGLDQAAVDAVKQWRFKPGTKDGVAVPVLAVVQVRFSIATGPPVLEWPAAFGARGAVEGWRPRELSVDDLQFQLQLPPDWDDCESQRPNQLFFAHHPSGARMFDIARPRLAPMQIDEPLTPGRLRGAAERLKALMASGSGEVAGVGQVRVGERLWIWVEARLPSLEAARAAMPPELVDQMPWETGRLWIFSTTAGTRFLQAGFMLLYPPGVSPTEIDERTRQAGAEFATMLERLSIVPSKK